MACYSVSLKLLCLVKETYLLALVHLDTTYRLIPICQYVEALGPEVDG